MVTLLSLISVSGRKFFSWTGTFSRSSNVSHPSITLWEMYNVILNYTLEPLIKDKDASLIMDKQMFLWLEVMYVVVMANNCTDLPNMVYFISR